MDQINVKARKWGNSLGIILPKIVVDNQKIDEGSDLIISVKSRKNSTAGDIMELSKKMGVVKKLTRIDTQKLLKRVDTDFWSD